MIWRILLLLAIGLSLMPGQAASPSSKDLDQRITETLGQRKYAWVAEMNKQRRAKSPLPGPIEAVRQALDRLEDSITGGLRSFVRWLDRQFSRSQNEPRPKGPPHMPHVSLWTLGTAGGLALLAAAFLMRRRGPAVVSPTALPAAVTRIEEEQTLATALPEQEWMRLAGEYFGRGEGRLAVRALHLAELAVLADRGLVSISAYKTTADYRADLRRRGRSAAMTDIFRAIACGMKVPGTGHMRFRRISWRAFAVTLTP